MADALINFMYVISRYFHLISMTLLVGGTLFYLWVVPTAIAELKEPHIVFARARWVFRRVVFASVLLLLVTGAIITARSMWVYRGDYRALLMEVARVSNPQHPNIELLDHPTIFDMPALWFVFHVALGIVGLIIAVLLVRGSQPPPSSLPWMRINFVILLLAILMAVMTRNARLRLFESVRPTAVVTPSMNQG